MVEPVTLLRDLRGLIQTLSDELRHLVVADPDPWGLHDGYAEALSAERTSLGWTSWYEERLEDIAAGWVLGTVFVRYAEDNGLIHPREPAGDASTWWRSRFEDLTAGMAADPRAIVPAFGSKLPEPAAQRLTAFWQRADEQHRPIHTFADIAFDTSVFGDLYQELSETAQARYALVQTPAFVTQFILDQTLDPAIEDFGLEGFAVLDPVCGSGSFLLDAFHRLLTLWHRTAPDVPTSELARRALDSIHGIDLNPVAVLISRFRLLIAARAALGGGMPSDAWPLHIATGDALLDVAEDLEREPELLKPGRYHVVVGNPPYITVKDRALDRLYRDRYDACVGKYSLSVPFIQRCFELASPGDEWNAAGYVGLLTANSFAKREFGRKLITEFFAERVTLTRVIDTAGAFIPGHGTPTLIIIGHNQPGNRSDRVLIVAGLHGEPEVPDDPAHGQVWQSIIQHASRPGHADRWTESDLIPRTELQAFPWNLASRRAITLHSRISDHRRLGEATSRITYLANTGADDLFTAPQGVWTRFRTESAYVVGVITGSEVRDWTAIPGKLGFFPRQQDLSVVDIHSIPGHYRRLWPFRTTLSNRPYYSGRTFHDSHREWYDWHSVSGAPEQRDRRIAFAWVATHTHFAALDDLLALPSAPVIELASEVATEHLSDLVALLNSSTVCFWLKQVSSSKGVSSVHHTPGTSGEPWEATYEFTPARLRDVPLPPTLSTQYGAALARLANELVNTTPAAIVATAAPTADRLAAGRNRWEQIRAQMIALAEEQDWETYRHYGLLPDPALASSPGGVPPLRLGERAFEIALAQDTTSSTQWFARHGSTPVTSPPTHWPDDYRDLVNARLSAIATDRQLNLLERPEFKRRWAAQSWDSLQADALREWLMDRCEIAISQEAPDGRRPHPRPRTLGSLSQELQSDASVVEVAKLLAPDKALADVLHEILADEHVPCLAVSRFKESGLAKRTTWETVWRQQREDTAHIDGTQDPAASQPAIISLPEKYVSSDYVKPGYWRLRGKFDVPSERFTSYPQPGTREGILLGWAGWDHAERAQVLTDLIEEELAADSPNKDTLVVLLATLHELQQWGAPSVEPTPPQSPSPLYQWLDQIDLTLDDLVQWRPQPPRRGRPRTSRA